MGGGGHVCVLDIPVLDEMSTFHDISFGLRGVKRYQNDLPKEQNILSAGICFMFHSVLRMLSLCDMISCLCVGKDDGELVSFLGPYARGS